MTTDRSRSSRVYPQRSSASGTRGHSSRTSRSSRASSSSAMIRPASSAAASAASNARDALPAATQWCAAAMRANGSCARVGESSRRAAQRLCHRARSGGSSRSATASRISACRNR